MLELNTFWQIYLTILFLSCFPDEFSFHENQDIKQESELAEQLYIKLFKRQRADQLDAIKNFKKINNYEKQYSLLMVMAEKIFSVIKESRAAIENSPFIPGVSNFPSDDKVRNALSTILENTALFSEITLRFPEIASSVLSKNNTWDTIFQWGIAFSYQMKFLLDNSTVRLLYLVSQELNHTDREPNYTNPYRKVPINNQQIVGKKTTSKKKRTIKKGPKLSSHFEL
ncbi:coiled-coil domain-containing protein 134 [Leptinotarsa decemlineata]|uniref:coiled-coil domain-containing protein 134 n=1 Tax=Leptinotarsa decemlineata TaxID=7539 RepID=UPI003D30D2FD